MATHPSRLFVLAGVGLALGGVLLLRRRRTLAKGPNKQPPSGKQKSGFRIDSYTRWPSHCDLPRDDEASDAAVVAPYVAPYEAGEAKTYTRWPSHCERPSADEASDAAVMAPREAGEAKRAAPLERTRRSVFVDVDTALLDVSAERVNATLARYGGALEFHTEVLHRPGALEAVGALLADPTLDLYFVCTSACGANVTNKWRWLSHYFGDEAADRLIVTNDKAVVIAGPGALLVSADEAIAGRKGVTAPNWNSEEWCRHVRSLGPDV